MDGKVTLLPTLDGSLTYYNQEIHQTYHSVNGALQEARHVFLESGLLAFLVQKPSERVQILEVGFGAGLNFLVVADFCEGRSIDCSYTGIEPYPLSKELFSASRYNTWIHHQKLWNRLLETYPEPFIDHSLCTLSQHIKLEIIKKKIQDFETSKRFDLIFYDAFAPGTQPEMWAADLLAKVSRLLNPGGYFITYSITGNLKRVFRGLQFEMYKPKGAAGKREMFRAVNPI